MNLFNLFPAAAIPSGRLRQEIFSLGGRHRGDALAGARLELLDPQLSREQERLLKAVVAHLKAETGSAATGRQPDAKRGRLTAPDAIYLGLIGAAGAWAWFIVQSMAG